MEFTLHRQLKTQLGPGCGGWSEVVVEGFRIDAVRPEGWLVEVQSGALGPLRAKLAKLLSAHRVQVVKPLIVERRIVRRTRVEGPDQSARRSPKRGAIVDIFNDLVGLAGVFPHPNLAIEVLSVAIDEIRTPRRRWPGYQVADRILRRIVSTTPLRVAGDLWTLVGVDPGETFTTRELAARLGRSLDFAQRVAYCLRRAGAVEGLGKRGHCRLYARPRPGETGGAHRG
jgi:hypothetical protein